MLQPAPGSRGVPPEAQCRDDKQNCPLGQYCKGGVCHRMVMCHDDSGCSPTQCCMKSGPYGICSDAPGAGQLCLVPVRYCVANQVSRFGVQEC